MSKGPVSPGKNFMYFSTTDFSNILTCVIFTLRGNLKFAMGGCLYVFQGSFLVIKS